MDKLSQAKINIIRRHFIGGDLDFKRIGKELEIHPETVRRYFQALGEIRELFPRKVKDFNFFPSARERAKHAGYEDFKNVLWGLAENTKLSYLHRHTLWKEYREQNPEGRSLTYFNHYFTQWQRDYNVCRFYPRHIRQIPVADLTELRHWRNSRDLHLWRKAVVILDSLKKRPVADLAAQVEKNELTVLAWIERYKRLGTAGLRQADYTPNPDTVAGSKIKQENILKLLQQTPKLHGLNRAAWSVKALSHAYLKVYGTPLSNSSVSRYLGILGYHFQKSRERLTSPDKNFREKMDRIKAILTNLQPDEKFFSIDEYGPTAVKIKTGWSISKANEHKEVPAVQKSRGWYILTAALELSTNQVTHFYSKKKDTAETIKLIDMLRREYKKERILYLSWDMASWHVSKMLCDYLKEVNAGTGPCVELAPLPSSAQHLNIIESVFSGMAKAVIHNSDYGSIDECQLAIDRYFAERNAYFREHPKKAGNKVWGREIVPPVFRETNNCRNSLKKKRTKSRKKIWKDWR